MDKPRHPQVIRTWKVERTKTPIRGAQPPKATSRPRRSGSKPRGGQ